jgi:uncharacterized protein
LTGANQRSSFDIPQSLNHLDSLATYPRLRQKFVPAMYLAGLWKTEGEHFPKDLLEGLELIQKAAARNYGPALYQMAIRHVDGRDLSLDFDKGLQEMRSAATLGSRQAQFDLGSRYETGNGVPRDLDRARRYYRLCAA